MGPLTELQAGPASPPEQSNVRPASRAAGLDASERRDGRAEPRAE